MRSANPQSRSALRLALDHRRPHRDAAEGDLGVGLQIAEPSRMTRKAELGCDDRDQIPIVEVDDDVAPQRTGLRPPSFEQGGRHHEPHPHPTPSQPDQGRVELPDDVDRHLPPQSGIGVAPRRRA